MKTELNRRLMNLFSMGLALIPAVVLGAVMYFYFDLMRGHWAFLVAGIILYLGCAVGVSSIFQRLVVKRIQRLVEILDEVRNGNLQVRIQESTFTDEIGTLERSFNSLVATLEESRQVLEKKVEELEKAHITEMEQEERFQLALKGADLGLWDENFQTGESYFSERWANMLGYDLSEITQSIKSWEDLVHPDDLPQVYASFDEHVKGLKPMLESEFRMRAKSGEWRWILSRGKLVERLPDGSPLRAVGTHLDITDSKYAEKMEKVLYRLAKAVSLAEDLPSLYQSLYDIITDLLMVKHVHIAMYHKDTDTVSFPFYVDEHPYPNGQVKSSSAGLTGYLLKTGTPLLITGPEALQLEKEEQFELQGETVVRWMGAPMKTATGEMIGAIVVKTFDENVHFTKQDLDLLAFISAHAAMSLERKMAEDAMRDSERRLGLALRGADLGIWDYNYKTGRVVRNERWAEILGLRLEEVEPEIGFLAGRVHPDDRDRVNEVFRLHQDGYVDTYSIEYRVLNKSGEWSWILDRGQVVERDEEGQPVRIVGTHLDITGRKRSELLQKALYRISEASVNMQELDDLYRYVQEVVNELMPAENFYIALLDPTGKRITFPFSVDEFDTDAPDMPYDPQGVGGGLTAYLLRHGEPLLIDAQTDKKLLEEGEVDIVGEPMLQWLGAPLKTSNGRVIGALVVQRYHPGLHYKESDKDLLAFVASQVGTAIERVQSNQAIRESEERFRHFFEQSAESILLTDEEGRIALWNMASEEITGIRSEDAIGQFVWDIQFQLLPPERRSEERYENFKRFYQNALNTGKVSSDQAIDAKTLRADGRLVHLLQTGFTIKTGKGFIIGAISQDITERRTNEERVQRQLRQMEALRTIDNTIASSFEIQVVLGVLLEQITNQLNVDAASILSFNPATQTLEFAASEGFHTDALRHTRLRLGESFGGQAALQRQMVLIEDISKSPGELTRAMDLDKEEFVTYIGLPLVAKGQLKGVLEIFNRSRLDPNKEWFDFLQTLAGQTAIAMDNASLFTQLQHSNLELSMAYDTTLEGWAHALELRDMETEGHSRRVTDMTVELAVMLGVQNDQLVNVRRGALLHDIGKMGIPDSILFKRGPLTEKEWQTMYRHPQYAYEMLSPIEFLRPALEIPYCHHEKWDGSGYPRKLKGEEIPLAARIFAVVDVWDSLTHKRPYKDAWPEAKAISYIQKQGGLHFDPHVVKVFMRTLEKTKMIRM